MASTLRAMASNLIASLLLLVVAFLFLVVRPGAPSSDLDGFI